MNKCRIKMIFIDQAIHSTSSPSPRLPHQCPWCRAPPTPATQWCRPPPPTARPTPPATPRPRYQRRPPTAIEAWTTPALAAPGRPEPSSRTPPSTSPWRPRRVAPGPARPAPRSSTSRGPSGERQWEYLAQHSEEGILCLRKSRTILKTLSL